jgi:hypothetical protein
MRVATRARRVVFVLLRFGVRVRVPKMPAGGRDQAR